MRFRDILMAGVAILLFAPSAHAAPATQGWAHAEKVVDLGLNAPPSPYRTTEDVLAIQDVFARWGIAYDEGRIGVIESLFTEDAAFQVLLGSAKPLAASRGRAVIAESVRSALAQQGDQRRHAISNVVVDQSSADRASVIAYGIVAIANDPPVIGATVIYSADLIKQGGVWRFTRFVIGMDTYVGSPPGVGK